MCYKRLQQQRRKTIAMPKIAVRKSILIDSPSEEIYSVVRDFKRWPMWSPWLIADPSSEVQYSEDGLSYSWDGPVTGVGGMEILNADPPRSIDYRLSFLKPWKSLADVRFTFADRGGKTEVVWSMDGSLPFFMGFFKKMMQGFIGMDYQRGLEMLKDYIEAGYVPSKLGFLGQSTLSGFNYVGVRNSCSTAGIGPAMGRDLERLRAWLAGGDQQQAGPPFSIYHRWNVAQGTAAYTLGIPLKGLPTALPKDLISGTVAEGEVYRVKHTGAYRHLGNAWAAGMMHARSKQFRQNRAIHPFEIYQNDPAEVPEGELVTMLHFPAK
jgi:effector-binding domain-containing protein